MTRRRRRDAVPWGVIVCVGLLLVAIAGIALAAVYVGGAGQ